MTKRQAQQLDFDEIIHEEMAQESGTGTTQNKQVRFNLPDGQGQRSPVKFTVTMNDPQPTTSNEHPLTKKTKTAAAAKKSEGTKQKPARTNPGTGPADTAVQLAHRATDRHQLWDIVNGGNNKQ